jgi:hypothetical protein
VNLSTRQISATKTIKTTLESTDCLSHQTLKRQDRRWSVALLPFLMVGIQCIGYAQWVRPDNQGSFQYSPSINDQIIFLHKVILINYDAFRRVRR